ncbi:MAG: rhomboid family intramembrane serine protease [Planctomycetota bacterium]|nr:rhomboid family intramembrane serine protease [Planctomycetota bacterium]
MGLDNRDYFQQPPPEYRSGGSPAYQSGGQGRMIVTQLVIINAVVYLFEILFDQTNITEKYLALDSGLFVTNWKLWQIITYGFVHSRGDVFHILGNMFCLWFFGREVEGIYGRRSFLSFYLSTIAIAGVLGLYSQELITGFPVSLLGASGGVAGVIILYICHFPHRTLLLYFVIPVRAWVLGVIFLFYDFVGTFSDTHVAHTAHLVGAACGWIYFKTGWDLSRWVPNRKQFDRLGPRRNVRLHQPKEDKLAEEVDRLLEKINREGTASLSSKERKTLERASQQYKDRQGPDF